MCSIDVWQSYSPAKKFTENQSYNWTKILPSVVKFYNDKYHKTLKMSPREASDDSNSLQIFLQHQSRSTKSPKQKRPMFSVGDHVRISRIKGIFEKGSDIGCLMKYLQSQQF